MPDPQPLLGVQPQHDHDERCGSCGLTFGAHRYSDNTCPGHQGWADWDAGPGTTFTPTGEIGELPRGTPAIGTSPRSIP